ncbi:MAG: hypothetical protein FRX48_07964 [Lasallia pustulata]|uniref:Uncharacterized protein n=1 Tax=Lasallia pustulata TaxID=136370 RepID=A0A5M8PHX3_9LECA|nr:MAG: hypothetical protein FRX48_07964 [Lasallia pustulata]
MGHLLARLKSSSSLRHKNLEPSIATPSDQQPREAKNAKYRTVTYSNVLATKGSFMDESVLGITDASKNFAEPYSIQSRRFLRTRYLAMTCSSELAERYKIKMRPGSFKISVD